MPIYTYSPEKNLKLIQERNISFEEIIVAIENDLILDIVEHPNQNKYENQKNIRDLRERICVSSSIYYRWQRGCFS